MRTPLNGRGGVLIALPNQRSVRLHERMGFEEDTGNRLERRKRNWIPNVLVNGLA